MERPLARREGAKLAGVAALALAAGVAIGSQWPRVARPPQLVVATAAAPEPQPREPVTAPALEPAPTETRATTPAENARSRELAEARAEAEAKREAQRAAARAAEETRQRVWSQHRAWADAATQVRDPAARARALSEMLAALHGDDPALAAAALQTVPSLWDIDCDKGAFAAAARRHLVSAEGRVRHAALRALTASGPTAADLPLLLPLVEDPERDVRGQLGDALRSATSGALEGPAEAAMLRLLADQEQFVSSSALSALGTCKLTPALEEAILDPAADVRRKQDVIHFVLNRSGTQSEQSLEFLADAIADPALCTYASNPLRRGVPDAARPRIAERAVAVLRDSPNSWHRIQVLQVLESVAGPDQLAALEIHASNPMVGERERAAVQRTVDSIGRRLDAGR